MIPKSKAPGKAEAVKIAREKAGESMLENGSCAYSTVRALQDTFGLEDEALLKASGGLTGGIGGLYDVCGSMLGAILVLGAVCGCGRHEGMNNMDKLFESGKQAADYYLWFKGENGTVNCRDMITKHGKGVFYDYRDREQFMAAIEAGVLDRCRETVQDNTAKAAEILWDLLHKGKKRA
jgi:C_GCAxxG_C_C family probable redox protein